MCIRDRFRIGQMRDDLARAPAIAGRAAVDRIGVQAGDVCPVSYTHLRAHETVLDLVCRLLLEKKTHSQLDKH